MLSLSELTRCSVLYCRPRMSSLHLAVLRMSKQHRQPLPQTDDLGHSCDGQKVLVTFLQSPPVTQTDSRIPYSP